MAFSLINLQQLIPFTVAFCYSNSESLCLPPEGVGLVASIKILLQWGFASLLLSWGLSVLFSPQEVALTHHMILTSYPADYLLPKLNKKFPFLKFWFFPIKRSACTWLTFCDPISSSSLFKLAVHPITIDINFPSFFLWLEKTISYVFIFFLLAKNQTIFHAF